MQGSTCRTDVIQLERPLIDLGDKTFKLSDKSSETLLFKKLTSIEKAFNGYLLSLLPHTEYKMKLYIIGNGFDVHHGLDTKYTSFGLYLKQHYNEVYELLLEHYGFCDLDPDNDDAMSDPLWSTFETSLSYLDTEAVLEAHKDSLPMYNSDEFKDRDRYTFQIDMEIILEKLTVKLYRAFKEFILSVQFPAFDQNNFVNIDINAKYINFNYTDTLAKYYHIPDKNVLFIHEKAEHDGSDLVLGHGIDPENFKDKPVLPPKNISDEEYEEWRQYMSDQYDYSYELGKDMINRYFTETFKGTDKIIERNAIFLNNLGDIDEVYVLGHSLAEVDLPYFKVLVKSIKPDIKWTATYYASDDQQKHFDTLISLGIKKASIVKIKEI